MRRPLTAAPRSGQSNIVKYEPCLHIVLFEPEIPHNAGSVGRTCVALGAKLWLVRPLGFRVDDRHLRRAGLDYWQHLEWQDVDNWDELTQQLGDRRFWYFTKTASRAYTEPTFEQGDVMVFGSESKGLPETMLKEAGTQALRVPVRPDVRSLNLSNTVAVVGYEAARQWNAAG